MPATALSASNRSQLAYKLEGVYPTNFGVPQGGNGALMNMLSETLDFTVETEQSKQLRTDRQVPDIVQVGATAQGGFSFESQYKEYDAFIEAVIQSSFTAYGTSGVSAASTGTLTATSSTLTSSVATSGADLWTTLDKGQWFTIIPAAGESAAVKSYLASRPFRLHGTTAATSTVLTLDAATPINTTIIASPLIAGWKISSSRLSNGNTMKSYTLEVQHGDIGQFRQYAGMIPSKMDLKLEVKKIVTGMFEFLGKDGRLLQSTSMGTPVPAQTYTPANATKGVFDILEGGASISATTYIKSADISIDNSLRIQDAVGVFGAAGIASGTMKNMLKLSVYFADQTMYNKFYNGTSTSISIPVLDVDGNGYVYYFPRVKYTAAKVNTNGQDQDNMLEMEGMALPDITANSPTLGKSVVIYRCGV